MPTRTGRTKPSTTYSGRNKPTKYVSLLEDSFDSVRDLDGEDIYVYTDSGIEVSGTTRTGRTIPA